MTGRGIGGGSYEHLVRGRGHMLTVGLNASMSGGWSMTVMDKDGNRANMEREGIISTERDDLEAVTS